MRNDLVFNVKTLGGRDNKSRGKKKRITYTWPNSWAMVKAALSPLSWTMEHELELSHIVPSSASPSVSHFCIWGLRQIFSLPKEIFKFFVLKNFNFKIIFFSSAGQCVLGVPCEEESRIVMVRTGIIDIVKNALPFAEITQHLRGRFAWPVVQ